MSFQILDIVLYSHKDKVRTLSLNTGKVNIITGASKTGKTAIIDIVDYCLGSSKCKVPVGVISSTVSWYALKLQLDREQLFIARKVPESGSTTSMEIYIETGTDITTPLKSKLHQTTNLDGLRDLLTRYVGIVDNIHEPPPSNTRPPLSANIRHALFYNFQSQDEIISKKHLFHKQSEQFVPQAISDTLPYFLGAVPDDYIIKKGDLRRLNENLRKLKRKLLEAKTIVGEGYSKVNALFAEARDMGIIDKSIEPDSIETIINLLKDSLNKPVEELGDESAGEIYDNYLEERTRLTRNYRKLKQELDALKSLMKDEGEYTNETKEQKSRLESITIVQCSDEDKVICPLCNSKLDDHQPRSIQIEKALEGLERQLSTVDRNVPHLQKAIDALEEKILIQRTALVENKRNIDAILASNNRLSSMRDYASQRAHIMGRISLFVESLTEVQDTKHLESKIASIEKEIGLVEDYLNKESIQEKVESALSLIGKRMSAWANSLQLEHADSPLRIDIRKLTVIADTLNGPLPMDRTGSGANWVGYHLIAHLALHEWFSNLNRPVPRFLIIDQPSQVYFPPDRDDVTMDDISENDREAVVNMFKLIFDIIEELSPKMQVLITEHADIDENWYQNGIIEKWRGGIKLIPEEWQ